MLSEILQTKIGDFIDYALFIVLLMIIYYIVKFFVIGGKTREELEAEADEQRGRFTSFLKQKGKESEKRKEYEKREHHAKHPKAYLIHAIESCDKVLESLSKQSKEEVVSESARNLRQLKRHLVHATRHIRDIRREEKGETFQWLDNLFSHGGTAMEIVNKLTVPKADADDYDAKTSEIRKNVAIIRGVCGSIIQRLDQYVGEAKKEHLAERAAFERVKGEVKKAKKETKAKKKANRVQERTEEKVQDTSQTVTGKEREKVKEKVEKKAARKKATVRKVGTAKKR